MAVLIGVKQFFLATEWPKCLTVSIDRPTSLIPSPDILQLAFLLTVSPKRCVLTVQFIRCEWKDDAT
jgi:hypothetical protein